MSELFQEEVTWFADILLPVPIAKLFTYRVPRHLSQEVQIGSRVIVEFGRGRVLTGVVGKIHENPPQGYPAKYITEVLDPAPIVTETQLWLFQWIADYYMCAVGEVFQVALPSGLKVTSESRMEWNPNFDRPDRLEEAEQPLVQALQEKPFLTYPEAQQLVPAGQLNALLKALVAKQAIILYEEVKERYSPKKVRKLRLASVYTQVQAAMELLDQLNKHPKQQAVLHAILQEIGIHRLSDGQEGIPKADFLARNDLSKSALQTLVDKGILESYEAIIPRFPKPTQEDTSEVGLTSAQAIAYTEILGHFQEKDVVLLHGITGSGKTEVYIRLIQEVLASGAQVLFMLPEIALTTQIVTRLQKVFGTSVGVYHSKFSDNERVEVYRQVLNDELSFVVGVRSSIFLPFSRLGLIIVDEEHETSYKQFDPAPRYHARDVAIMMAHKLGAKVVLGSATPSLESYQQGLQGKYGLVSLTERYGEAKLPRIQLVDMRAERKNKTIKNDFSSVFLDQIRINLAGGGQTLIFQNRRGYAPYIQCEVCQWIQECPRCAVSMTYHLRSQELVCHYCGHTDKPPRKCPACASSQVKTAGVGTEKIEDDLQVFFPSARIQRMDLDTTRSRHAYQTMLHEFEQGAVDILVGTQMISKGLDFDLVRLVGIFDADRMIHFPDFRAAERAFQMLTQVAGRAGRRSNEGLVLIQTKNPNHPLLKKVVEHDYLGFFDQEIQERQAFHYPPFTRVIELTIKHPDFLLAEKMAERLARALKGILGDQRVLGPEKGLIEKIRNKFIFVLWVKLEKDRAQIQLAKQSIQEQMDDVLQDRAFRQGQIIVDVDAY